MNKKEKTEPKNALLRERYPNLPMVISIIGTITATIALIVRLLK